MSAYDMSGDHVEPREGYTERGFGIYLTGEDLDGIEYSVVQSSLADEDACRIYVKDERHAIEVSGHTLPPALHLSKKEATRLRNALDNFLLHVTNPS